METTPSSLFIATAASVDFGSHLNIFLIHVFSAMLAKSVCHGPDECARLFFSACFFASAFVM